MLRDRVRVSTGLRNWLVPKTVAASGGTITTSGDWIIHTFLTTANLIIYRPGFIELFMVGGGGGGCHGNYGGLGGGGGGYTSTLRIYVSTGTWVVTIGTGGATDSNGVASSFVKGTETYSIIGGYKGTTLGGNGGSGGGGGCGGGLPGGNGGTNGGNGYAGYTYYYGGSGQGVSTYAFQEVAGIIHSGGGGGGGSYGAGEGPGTGGANGGGNGGALNNVGANGTANTGGGGGGGGGTTNGVGMNGGTGGSGIVIVRYL